MVPSRSRLFVLASFLYAVDIVSCSDGIPMPSSTMGPVEMIFNFTAEHLELQRPALVAFPRILKELVRAGIGNFYSLDRNFGKEEMLLGDGVSFVQSPTPDMFNFSVAKYIEMMRDPEVKAPRLSENGGRQFMLSRPELYATVGKLVKEWIPDGYRWFYDYSQDDFDKIKKDVVDGNYGGSEFTLWAADYGFTGHLHADFGSSGHLLMHLEGKKRVWLFPPEQQHLLYMKRPDNDTNYEAVSDMADHSPTFTDARKMTKFPLLQEATPLVVDLRPGETLIIPCGWPHWVDYLGPALSISAAYIPDWAAKLTQDEDLEWYPRDCTDFHPSARDRVEQWAAQRRVELDAEEEDEDDEPEAKHEL